MYRNKAGILRVDLRTGVNDEFIQLDKKFYSVANLSLTENRSLVSSSGSKNNPLIFNYAMQFILVQHRPIVK